MSKNSRQIFDSIKNLGVSSGVNQEIIKESPKKLTLAETYKKIYDLVLSKMTPAHRKISLKEGSKAQELFINYVIEHAEKEFDEQNKTEVVVAKPDTKDFEV